MSKLFIAIMAFFMCNTAANAVTLNATPATFSKTLAVAKSGDTIMLAPGSYSTLGFVRMNYNPPLTIASNGAVVKGLYVSMSSNIKFDGLSIVAGPAATNNSQALRIINSSDIVIDYTKVVGGLATNGVLQTAPRGTLDATGNVIGLPSGKGINFETCNRCKITNSDISVFHKGITLYSGSDVVIDNNYIHNLRTSPISGVPGVNLTVTNNSTDTSLPWMYGGTGDHGDMLHFWTQGGPVKGLTITYNRFMQGSGFPIMGIFLQNKDGNFEGLTLSHNVVATSNGQGILLYGVSGKVEYNTLVWTSPSTTLDKYGKPINWREEPRLDIKLGSSNLLVCGTLGKVTAAVGLPTTVVIKKLCP